MPQMRGNKFLKIFQSILGMGMLKMLKCCFSGTMVTIWKVCFLILNSYTQLTTSLITVVSHSNSSFVDDQKNTKTIFEKIVKFLVKEPLNSVIFKLNELVIF